MADEFRALAAREDSGEAIIVEEALLHEAIPVARKYEDEADVIISRGGTVLVMRDAGIGTPIVEMQVTARDLASALEKARALTTSESPRIGVVTFPNMIRQLRDFLPFFSMNLSLYELSSARDAPAAMKSARNDGVDVLMGGVITEKLSAEWGIPVVLIESGETSFLNALQEAAKIVAARRLRDRRAEELRIITENISEGILAADRSGKVFRMNGVARKLLGLESEERLQPGLLELVKSGVETRKVFTFGQKRVVAESIPVKVQGSIASSVITLREAASIQKMEEELRRELYLKGLTTKFSFGDVVAEDPATLRVIELARRFAATNASILIRGESGVGKEVFAQSIHNASARRERAFVAMNCAAIPETLFESELFGYVDGAFTGARKKGKPGLFEIAHGGTVFLDEISEMPQALQARLLRVLQEHQVMRLGDDKVIPVDVRIIAASNRDIPALVRTHAFRTDLYWRLNVLNLMIPPLRERKRDIIPLARRLLGDQDFCGRPIRLSAECEAGLVAYDWPGNVRELKNFCERVAAICEDEELSAELAFSLLDADPTLRRPTRPGSPPAAEVHDLAAFVEAEGGVSAAASKLGIHRSTLWRRLKKNTD